MSILHQLEARGEEPISSVFQVPYRWQTPVLFVVSITLVREAMGISSRMNFPPRAALIALFPCLLPAVTEHICLTGVQGCSGTLAPGCLQSFKGSGFQGCQNVASLSRHGHPHLPPYTVTML